MVREASGFRIFAAFDAFGALFWAREASGFRVFSVVDAGCCFWGPKRHRKCEVLLLSMLHIGDTDEKGIG
ncbi:MAG: hypothetical protein K6B39_04300, partial [Lachnospiraceae bacterium]|nr:hypothetical protein [Lachnospiraceae bacterium]